MDKLDLTKAFYKRYKSDIHPDVKTIKFCQDNTDCYLEIIYHNKTEPYYINLDFISGDVIEDEDGNFMSTGKLFAPENDMVDNAKCLLEMDDFSVINCFSEILNEEACERINKEFLKNYPRFRENLFRKK